MPMTQDKYVELMLAELKREPTEALVNLLREDYNKHFTEGGKWREERGVLERGAAQLAQGFISPLGSLGEAVLGKVAPEPEGLENIPYYLGSGLGWGAALYGGGPALATKAIPRMAGSLGKILGSRVTSLIPEAIKVAAPTAGASGAISGAIGALQPAENIEERVERALGYGLGGAALGAVFPSTVLPSRMVKVAQMFNAPLGSRTIAMEYQRLRVPPKAFESYPNTIRDLPAQVVREAQKEYALSSALIKNMPPNQAEKEISSRLYLLKEKLKTTGLSEEESNALVDIVSRWSGTGPAPKTLRPFVKKGAQKTPSASDVVSIVESLEKQEKPSESLYSAGFDALAVKRNMLKSDVIKLVNSTATTENQPMKNVLVRMLKEESPPGVSALFKRIPINPKVEPGKVNLTQPDPVVSIALSAGTPIGKTLRPTKFTREDFDSVASLSELNAAIGKGILGLRASPEYESLKRGHLSLKVIGDFADELGLNRGAIVQNWRAGDTSNAEQAFAHLSLLESGIQSLQEAGAKARVTMDTQDIANFLRTFTKLRDFMGVVSAGISESMRTGAVLRHYKTAKGVSISDWMKWYEGGEAKAKVLAKMLKAGSDASLLNTSRAEIETLIHSISMMDSPRAVSNIVQNYKPGKLDRALTWWTSALISGPITQWVNWSSNQTLLFLRHFVERPLQAAAEVPLAALQKREREVLFGQAGAELWGFLTSIPTAVRAMKLGFELEGLAQTAAKTEISPGAVAGLASKSAGVVDKLAGYPFRLLAAGDAMAKVQAVAASLSGQAYKIAVREGKTPISSEFKLRVSELLKSPTVAMVKEAERVAAESTFVAPLGPTTQSIVNFRNRHPWVRFALPFIRTPYNIAIQGVERIPGIGLIRPAVKGELGDRASELAARQAVGGLTALAVGLLVKEGKITGGLPKEPSYRATQIAAGRPPYSILVGDKWYAYDRYEPLATVVGTLADMWSLGEQEGWKSLDEVSWTKAAGRVADSIATLVSAKTYFKGVGDVIDAVLNPTVEGEKWLQAYLSSFIPAASAQTARFIDPTARDLTSNVEGAMGTLQEIKNSFLYRIPYLSKKLPPKQDVFGQPVSTRNPFMGVPYKALSDPVASEIIRLQVRLSQPERKVGEVILNATQYEWLQTERGLKIHTALKRLITTRNYLSASDTDRVSLIQSEIRKHGGIPKEKLRKDLEKQLGKEALKKPIIPLTSIPRI